MKNSICCQPNKKISRINAPASKSMMQRVVAASVFCRSAITIYQPSYCQDSLAALTMAHNLGVFKLESCDTTILKPTNQQVNRVLDAGDSGLAFRMFVPIAATFGGSFQFVLGKSLQNRPLKFVEEVLHQSDIATSLSPDSSVFTINGNLKAGNYTIDGSVSSQLLTGLLMALPTLKNDSFLEVQNLKSRSYIDWTLQILNRFGITIDHKDYQYFTVYGNQQYQADTFWIEGDWSNAAFALVLGAIDHPVQVKNLNLHSVQSDKVIIDVLQAVGAHVKMDNESIFVSKGGLQPFSFDADDSPDLVPPLTLLAACCDGVSTIYHINRLKFKESNRIEALMDVFRKLNITVYEENDTLKIQGGTIKGGLVDSFNDHRIAMTAAIASFVAENPIEITQAQCVEKSYPEFWDVFFER